VGEQAFISLDIVEGRISGGPLRQARELGKEAGDHDYLLAFSSVAIEGEQGETREEKEDILTFRVVRMYAAVQRYGGRLNLYMFVCDGLCCCGCCMVTGRNRERGMGVVRRDKKKGVLSVELPR